MSEKPIGELANGDLVWPGPTYLIRIHGDPDRYVAPDICNVIEGHYNVLARLEIEPRRVVTTPADDPVVQACIDNGGHFWPDPDCEGNEPQTCIRCWFNPGWVKGEPRNESNVRPIRDEPQA